MQLTSHRLTLTLATAIATLVPAAPPTFAKPGKTALAAPSDARTGGSFAPQIKPKPVLQVQPRFPPPRAIQTFKPMVPVIKPVPPAVRPANPTIRPTLPVMKPTRPTLAFRQPVAQPKPVPQPIHGRDLVLKDHRVEPIITIPGFSKPVGAPMLDAALADAVDTFRPGNLPVLDLGNAGAAHGNGGGNVPPPVVGDADAAGPTTWDWVAIGLSAAALANRLADQRGGSYVNDRVVIERPVVQTVPVTETTVIHEEPVVVHEQPVIEAVREPASVATGAAVAAPSAAESLPQLRVGKPFELPAKGLGATPGRVAVKVGAVILECPVVAWTDAGLTATVAAMTLEAPVPADLIVALADGTVAAKVPVELLPAADRMGGPTR